jgi:hypothetical protein
MSAITQEIWGRPLGFQQIALDTTAVGLTVPTGASVAVITVAVANASWRDDGTDPTASVGHIMTTTHEPFVYRGDLGRIKFIEVSGAPLLNVTYYGTEPAAT